MVDRRKENLTKTFEQFYIFIVHCNSSFNRGKKINHQKPTTVLWLQIAVHIPTLVFRTFAFATTLIPSLMKCLKIKKNIFIGLNNESLFFDRKVKGLLAILKTIFEMELIFMKLMLFIVF